MKQINLERILRNIRMNIKKGLVNTSENLVKMKDLLEILDKSIINLKLFHVQRPTAWGTFRTEKCLIEIINL